MINKDAVKKLLADKEITNLIKTSDYKTLFSEDGIIMTKYDWREYANLAAALYSSIGNKLFEGMKEIPTQLFWNFKELTSISIPEGIKKIGDFAFYGCENLKKVDLPKSLTYIGKHAFSYSGLQSIIIPEKVNHLGTFAFGDCNNLREIKFENLPTYGVSDAFDGPSFTKNIKVYMPKFDSEKYGEENDFIYEFALGNLESVFNSRNIIQY